MKERCGIGGLYTDVISSFACAYTPAPGPLGLFRERWGYMEDETHGTRRREIIEVCCMLLTDGAALLVGCVFFIEDACRR